MGRAPLRRAASSRPAAIILVAVATLLATWPVLQADFVQWDDDRRFLDNPEYRGLGRENLVWMATTFMLATWEPLTWASCALDHAIWGMEPFGYHLTGWLLHAGVAVLLYLVLERLLGTAPAGGRFAALAGALAWSLHPLRVEPVVWVSARGYLLAGLFLLAATLAWFRALEAPRGGRRCLWLSLSIAAYTVSLLGKPIAIAFAAVLLVLDGHPLGRLRGRVPRRILEKAPFALLAIPFAVLAIKAKAATGALHGFEARGLEERAALAVFGTGFYPVKTVLPVRLSPLYVLDARFPRHPAIYVIAALAAAGVTVAAIRSARRHPALLAAWLVYLLFLAPLSGVLQSGPQKAADRYTYLAGLPVAALVAAGISRLPGRRGRVAAGAALVALAVLTCQECRVWRDSESLWLRAVALDDENFFAHHQAGVIALDAGRTEEALAHFERAIEIHPRYASPYVGRGLVLERKGDRLGALADYDRAIQCDPRNGRAHFNRGNVLFALGLRGEALASFDRAVELEPSHADAWNNRGAVRLLLGDREGAIEDFRRALDLGLERARENLERANADG